MLDELLDMAHIRKHTVVMPENLATISKTYYGSPKYAMAIFQANRSQLVDPNRVPYGAVLVIPHLPHVKPWHG